MPSHLHETLVEMFRERPVLAAELLGGPLGLPVPDFHTASLSPGELTDVMSTEYRADLVITLTTEDTPVLAVVVEAQLRIDHHKRRSWPAYVATLHARSGCPVALLVVSPNHRVAEWCAVPIVVGEPDFVLTPLVLGPGEVPVVTDPVLAKLNPELAVLSALAHGRRSAPRPIFEALLAALDVVDQDHADLYADVVLAALPSAARDYLEALMSTTTHQYQSDFARRYFERGQVKGKAEGEARAVLVVLDARGIEVPDDARDRITGCTDVARLETWARRAATADKVQDLFDE